MEIHLLYLESKNFVALDPVPTYAFPINPGVKTKSKLPLRASLLFLPSLSLSLWSYFKISRQVSSSRGRKSSLEFILESFESTRMDENLCAPLGYTVIMRDNSNLLAITYGRMIT